MVLFLMRRSKSFFVPGFHGKVMPTSLLREALPLKMLPNEDAKTSATVVLPPSHCWRGYVEMENLSLC